MSSKNPNLILAGLHDPNHNEPTQPLGSGILIMKPTLIPPMNPGIIMLFLQPHHCCLNTAQGTAIFCLFFVARRPPHACPKPQTGGL